MNTEEQEHIDTKKHLLSMSINDLACLMAAVNANHFKVKPEHMEQWILNRKRDYIAAAGETIRHYGAPAPKLEVVPTPTTNPHNNGSTDE